ncbi:ABC transporter permease [Pasteurellaceae bacterium LIM206]|nr:ABC transporter permease [Pasteurellaceae bacterium LIM206]
MKVSYRSIKSLSLLTALLPLLMLLLTITGAITALIRQLNWQFIKLILTDTELYFALGMSIGTSVLSLIFALLIAIPSAWTMSQRHLPGQKLIDTLLDLPMVLPPLVTGLSLLLFFNANGWFADIVPLVSQWIFSPAGIIIAQTYIASSIMLRNTRGVFASIDPGYRFTAYSLGLSPLHTLLKIELPMCWKPLMGGAILSWSRAIGEFGATLMLAGATRFKTETLPMAVYLNISSGDFELAVGAALWLLIISAVLLLLLRLFNKDI